MRYLTLKLLSRTVACCLLLLCSATALAQEPGQIGSGFVLQASLGGHVGLFSTVGTSSNTAVGALNNGLQVGMLLGYKSGRAIIGLGLDFLNFTDSPSTSVIGSPSATTSVSELLLVPEVQAAIVRSADHRVEMIADFALGLGHVFISQPGSTTNDSNFLLSYQVGPGVRYWAHRHFAVQALTGFAGQVYFDLPPAGSTGSGTISVHSIFASAGAVGVF